MKKSSILAVDVGNTSTVFAHVVSGKIKKCARIATHDARRHALAVLRKDFSGKKIDAVVIASVVPSAARFLKRWIPVRLRHETLLIGSDIQAPVKNLYRNPRQVGIDRLMNAVAAYARFRKAAIVVDFGTAITLDVISQKGEYLGGVIAPGIEISLEALFRKTALLPKTRLAHVQNVVGRDTVESIRIGCSVGIGGLCERLIDEISRRHRLKPAVLATGGYARFMSRYCRKIRLIDEDLVLRGIWLTYRASLTNA